MHRVAFDKPIRSISGDVFMLRIYGYAQADPEFYAPLSRISEAGRRFTPEGLSDGWTCATHDIWTVWRHPEVVTPDQGWKVHVSARLDRADFVLNTVARACDAEKVAFKHLSAEAFFLFVHHKHGPRSQAGKFCALYPADERAALRLMERLARDLAEEEGPYVLSDRRFRDSRTVHYRYGAFRSRSRMLANGDRESLVRDGNGLDVPDVRGVSFTPPPGIEDPFTEPPDGVCGGPVTIHGYEIVQVLQHSNAGGSYQAKDTRTGRIVFVKEARAHNGLFWDRTTAVDRLRREHRVLTEIHLAVPGACPEPLDYFQEWEHEFLVTEFVEGTPLNRWMARHSPLIQSGRSVADFDAFYGSCTRFLDELDHALGRIHQAGYRYGDLNPRNVMVSPAGARLIDFESCEHRTAPLIRMGANGYIPPEELALEGPFAWDEYGLSAVALGLIMPLHSVIQRSSGNLRLLRRDVERHAPVPAELWRRATRFHNERDTAQRLPTPEELDERPRESLGRFAEQVRIGLADMVGVERLDRVFPTVPRGYETNLLSVAYGLAGILHALQVTGSTIPAELVERLRVQAVNGGADLPPGLHIGAAGVGWILADLGLLDEAGDLLTGAARHPVLGTSTTLGEGRAGIGMAALRMHLGTGEQRFLDMAVASGEAIVGTGDLRSTLGPDNARGLLHGRSGLALFLHRLGAVTGDHRYVRQGRRLLHGELDLAMEMPDGALSFTDNDLTRRSMPYLFSGSAGVGLVLGRYAADAADERIAAALPRVLSDFHKNCCVFPALYCGLAGLAFALADYADVVWDPRAADDAVKVATGLVKYAIEGGQGVRFLGDGNLKFSAELWSGGAGVLLALHRVLNGSSGHFLLLD
ncbi:class III lanthionine synthetase LanKC [Rhizohabitans arisaemae]|uniref:class III lanthionine synthetase LanKC n=1 Tax=Rhizohabitans arisaemae TaxID=2720610 RepID=UPI0024B08F8E|nr:class III lanthionine synthetase LanKC [Rhizohabitans arisaemae]